MEIGSRAIAGRGRVGNPAVRGEVTVTHHRRKGVVFKRAY